MLPGKLGPIIPGKEPIFGKRNESDMLGMIIVEWRKCLISWVSIFNSRNGGL